MSEFMDWLVGKTSWMVAPILGSLLTTLIGKDYSPGRILSGVLAGLFMAYYFTGWTTHYLPMPPNTDPDSANRMVGALWGLTGYFIIIRLVELIKVGQLQVLGGLFGIKGSKGE